jgi:hypothetical protein|tara:strand:+ start:13 stop:474 length:462 start_codon:yes stop_codon:yes gene_type:complete
MATIKCKGLTGVVFDVTVTLGSTTMNGLTALARAIEGAPITVGMYGEVRADKNPAINQTNDGAKTLTAAGLVEADLVVCVPLKTGNKEARQEQKGAIAQAKREGLAAADTDAVYYRALKTFNKNRLPNPYEADAYNADDDENTQTLQAGRPWT